MGCSLLSQPSLSLSITQAPCPAIPALFSGMLPAAAEGVMVYRYFSPSEGQTIVTWVPYPFKAWKYKGPAAQRTLCPVQKIYYVVRAAPCAKIKQPWSFSQTYDLTLQGLP